MTKEQLKVGMRIRINSRFLARLEGHTGIIIALNEGSGYITVKLDKEFKGNSELFLSYPDEFECITRPGEQLLLFELV